MSAPVIATASDNIPIREHFSPNWRPSRSVKAQFVGTWKLVSWKIEQANGEITDSPLGPNPHGWIMYQPGDACALRSCVLIALNLLRTT
jgi:hypothetical protein